MNYANWITLDQTLLGSTSFRGLTPDVMRHEILRFLIWGLSLTQVQRGMGWSPQEWRELSPRDLGLFYHIFFREPRIFAKACLSLWKQIKPITLEQKLLYGGLAKISPQALLNHFCLYVVKRGVSDWREWDARNCVPEITFQEWEFIMQICNWE